MVKRIQKKERMTERLADLLKFLVIINLLSIPLYIALYSDFSFKPLQEFNAGITSSALDIFGYESYREGEYVNLIDDGVMKRIGISWDSTGWKSMYAVAALIAATPVSRLSRRIKFAAVAIAAVFVINYMRILTTIVISANFGFNLFDIIHTFLWREGLILAVIGIWGLWMGMEKYNIGKIK